jgi:hypothetical protein
VRHAGSSYLRWRIGAYGRPIRHEAPAKCFAVMRLADQVQVKGNIWLSFNIELSDRYYAKLTLFIDMTLTDHCSID